MRVFHIDTEKFNAFHYHMDVIMIVAF